MVYSRKWYWKHLVNGYYGGLLWPGLWYGINCCSLFVLFSLIIYLDMNEPTSST